ELLEEIGRLRTALDRDPMAPRDLRPAIAGMAARLGRLQQGEKQPLQALARAPASEPTRKSAERQSGRQVMELEKDLILLDGLIGRQRSEQLLAVPDRMQEAGERLRNLLAEYKKGRSEAVRRDIEREIGALEQRLAELSAKAQHLAGQVPDEYLNREALGDTDL